ncbi:MAG: hypothetical protein QGG54_17460, partial [Gammaproteobacteria bacterium]|nr:hypothetical protein [Gammaproteobacteria bacterium]
MGTTTWEGDVSSNWATADNWSNGLPPGQETRIVGYGTIPNPVITGTGYTAGTVYVGTAAGHGELTLAAGAELYLTPTRDLMVGSTVGGSNSGDGVLTVNAGATITVTDDFRVACYGIADGTVNLYGTIDCHEFEIGTGSGTALIDIRDAGTLLVDGGGATTVASIEAAVDAGEITAYGYASYNPTDHYYLVIETIAGARIRVTAAINPAHLPAWNPDPYNGV